MNYDDLRPKPCTMSSSPHQTTSTLSNRNTSPPIAQLAVLFAAGCLSSAVGSMVAPVFPEIITEMRIDPAWAGLLVSIHTLTIALASPIFAVLASRLGYKSILVTALICYAGFGAAGAWMTRFWPMLALRGLVGAASGGIAAVSIGIVSGRYEGAARVRMMGYVTSALAIATVIFPVLGGWLGSNHWQHAFYLHGLGLPVALAVIFILQPAFCQSSQPTTAVAAAEIRQSLRQKSIWSLLLTLALASALFYVVVVYAPLYLKVELGASPIINGGVLATRALGAAVVSAVGASRLANRIGSNLAIAVGFLLMAFSLATIPNLKEPLLIILTALPFGVGFGIVMPNFYNVLADQAAPEFRTTLLAIGTGCSSLGQFVSPLLFGPIWKVAGERVFFVAAGLAVCIGVLMVWRERRLEAS
jgi:MFS transporter, ACDE family, multidrug resistance protein